MEQYTLEQLKAEMERSTDPEQGLAVLQLALEGAPESVMELAQLRSMHAQLVARLSSQGPHAGIARDSGMDLAVASLGAAVKALVETYAITVYRLQSCTCEDCKRQQAPLN